MQALPPFSHQLLQTRALPRGSQLPAPSRTPPSPHVIIPDDPPAAERPSCIPPEAGSTIAMATPATAAPSAIMPAPSVTIDITAFAPRRPILSSLPIQTLRNLVRLDIPILRLTQRVTRA